MPQHAYVRGTDLPPRGGGESEFPTPETSGVPPGTTLTPSGGFSTSSNGQVIQDLEVSDTIFVNHENVTIRRCLFAVTGQAITVDNTNTTRVTVEDCEFDGTGSTDSNAVIGDNNFNFLRCYVHHFGEGPRSNGNVLIEDCCIISFLDFSGVDAHQDTIQCTSGDDITIRHNTLEMNIDAGNAVIMVSTDLGSNLTIDNNLMYGGGYTCYGGSPGGSVPPPGWSNTIVTDNHFSTILFENCGFHWPLVSVENATVSGNVWHDDYGEGDYSTAREFPAGNGPRTGQPV